MNSVQRHIAHLGWLFFIALCCVGCDQEPDIASAGRKLSPKSTPEASKPIDRHVDVTPGGRGDSFDSVYSRINDAFKRIGAVGFQPDAFKDIELLIKSSTNVPRKELWDLAAKHLKGPLLDKATNCLIKFAGREMAADALSLASTIQGVQPTYIGAAIRDLYAQSVAQSASPEEQSAFIKSLKDQYHIPDEIVRASFVDFSSVASVDWERQRKVFESVLHETWINEETVRQAMDNLSLKQEEQTMQWIVGMKDVPILRNSITQTMGDWALREPDVAAQWLDNHKGSALYDWAAAGLVQAFKSIDPDGANVWLGTITNPDAVSMANSGVRRTIDPASGNPK